MRAHQFGRRRLRRPDPAKLGRLPLASGIPSPRRLAAIVALLALGRTAERIAALGPVWLTALQLYLGAFKADSGHASAIKGQQDQPVFQLFNFEREPPSIANLYRELTINGVTHNPTLWLKGENLNSTTWEAEHGEDLPEAGSGSDPASAGSPLMGADASVQYAGGKCNQATDSAFGDPSNYDIYFEMSFEWQTTGSYAKLFSKRATGLGIAAYVNSGVLSFRLEGASGTVTLSSVMTLAVGAWYRVTVAVKKSGMARMWINAVAKHTVSVSHVGSLSNSEKLTVGANSALGQAYSGKIGHIGYWLGADWLDTHEQDALVSRRFYAMTGTRPQRYAGSDVPSTMARDSVAYIDKYNTSTQETELYKVGEHWPKMCKRIDGNGEVGIYYVPETEATNRVYYSQQFDLWGTSGSPTVASNDAIAPDGTTTADKVGVTDTDYIYRTGTVGTASAVAAAGLWIKRVSTTNTLRITNTAGPTKGDWRIDMSGLPDRWVRITRSSPYLTSVVDEFVNGLGGQCGLVIWSEDTNQIDAHVWQGQYEERADREVSTDIETPAAAAVTRLKDVLEFEGLANIGGAGSERQGAIVLDYLSPTRTPTSSNVLVTMSDNKSGLDRIQLYTSVGQLSAITRASGGNDGGAVDPASCHNNSTHRCGCTWKTNRLELWRNGFSVGSTDTVCDIPDELDYLHVGHGVTSIAQAEGGVRNIRVYRRFQHDMASKTRMAA